MLPANEDKKMLIESMKKLTHHISNNTIRQKQIFESLSKQDLLKIITNLSDDNEYLRRISGLLLTQLFYNNDQIKYQAIKILSLFPQQGRICLNQIPYAIQKFPSTLKKCIQLMKSPIRQDQNDKFCWTINLDRKILQIQFLDYKKYSSFTFLDPNRNIFGFTFLKNSKQKKVYYINNINNTKNTDRSKQRTSIDSNISSKRQSIGMNNSFYKNYIDNRNRKHQSPSSYRQYHQKKQIIKLNTPKNNKYQQSSNYNQLNISNHKNNTTQFTQIRKDIQQRELYEKSITTPIKSNKDNMNLKLDIGSMNQSMKLGNGAVSERESSNSYRAPQTDRKHDPANNRMIDSGLFNNSTAEKSRYPESTKHSYISQHEKFYKRVKEILKR